jgi:hypothetical protein
VSGGKSRPASLAGFGRNVKRASHLSTEHRAQADFFSACALCPVLCALEIEKKPQDHILAASLGREGSGLVGGFPTRFFYEVAARAAREVLFNDEVLSTLAVRALLCLHLAPSGHTSVAANVSGKQVDPDQSEQNWCRYSSWPADFDPVFFVVMGAGVCIGTWIFENVRSHHRPPLALAILRNLTNYSIEMPQRAVKSLRLTLSRSSPIPYSIRHAHGVSGRSI